jgi:hypothetical protein
MAPESRTISSMEELLQAVPQIIDAANADPALTLRFAANPLFLAEELGYTLTDEMRHFAARRVRFSAETFERLQQLEQQVWDLAGERFDIDSEEALAHVLFMKLKIPRPQAHEPGGVESPEQLTQVKAYVPGAVQPPVPRLPTAPLPARPIGHGPIDDPLEPLRNDHPVMPPLLEYRQLEASAARLAPRAVYDRIARGDVDLPITRLHLRLKTLPKS